MKYLMNKRIRLWSLLVCFTSNIVGYAQGAVGIGTNDPHESAILEVSSGTRGVLIPRISREPGTTVITDAVRGLIVYNEHSSVNAFEYFDGTDWIQLIPTPAKFDIDMDSHKIIELADGTDPGDAVNRSQLDTKITRANGEVINSYIADDAVTLSKVANNAIDTDQIVNDAVTNAKIANDAVDTNQLADDAVNSSKVDGSIIITRQFGFVTDFDNELTPGIFPTFGTAANQPVAQRGILIVARVNIEIYQFFVSTINSVTYSRRSGDTGNNWDAWDINN